MLRLDTVFSESIFHALAMRKFYSLHIIFLALHFHFHASHIVPPLFETNDMNLWSLLTKNIMLMRKRILSSIGLFLLCMQVIAQTRTITGKITDENGVGISNASVRAKETSIGTTTDINGSFSLSL